MCSVLNGGVSMGKLLHITISTLVLIILLIVPHRTTNDQSTAFIELLHKSSTNGGNMSQKNVDQKSLEDIETFFKILHGPNPIDGCQVVFTVGRDNQNRKIYTFKPGELSHIKGVLSFGSMSNHMYYEVCLQQSIPPNGKRGSAKSTASMPGCHRECNNVPKKGTKSVPPLKGKSLTFR